MVKKAVAPAKKAAPARSTPNSKATAPVKAAAQKAPDKTPPAKSAPSKLAGSAAKAPPAKNTTAKSTTAKSAVQPSTPKQAVPKPAPTKQTSKESVKQPTADAPAPPMDKPAAAVAETRRAPAAKKAPAPPAPSMPPVKGETKEGIKYTKDFDAKFLLAQRKLLIEARESLTGQAVRLEDEANSLIDDEMGDVQFDDESGEGDTMVVERERDLFLSARARQDIEEIDSALHRLEVGTYGYSVVSMRPIPRERLEAIPWATELTEEKVGGIGRR